MSFGEWSIRITAWLAFGIWFVVVGSLIRSGVQKVRRYIRFTWLVGSVVMFVHVMLSFHYRHQWSHDAAVIETARQTGEMTGFDWGGGVWVNYIFSSVWLFDALWWCLQSRNYVIRNRWVNVMTHTFLGFIWFNATVVFGPPPIQIVGITAFVYLALRIIVSKRRATTL